MATGGFTTLIAGRYEVGEVLGRGGMAEVRSAFDRRLQRHVAIKQLHPQMAGDPGIRHRFDAEARAAAGLSHPNAVAVFDVGEHDGMPYFVMERLPGETLADLLRTGPIDVEWLRRAAGDVLGALGAAHDRGIVHRDVKPGNILITADRRAKIGDFGIAKSIEERVDTTGPEAVITLTGQLLGTPAYVAPERLVGAPANPRSDLYSLGVVLYEGLAGKRPFGGDSALAVAHAVERGDHVPLYELRPELDPGLTIAVERAMARHPEQRFATAEEMGHALGVEPAGVPLGGDPTLSMSPTATQLLPQGAVLAGELPPATPRRRSASATRRRAVAATLAALVVLVGVLAAVAARRPGGPPASSSPTTAAPTTTTAVIRSVAPRLTAPPQTEPPSTLPAVTQPSDTAPAFTPPSFFIPGQSGDSSDG